MKLFQKKPVRVTVCSFHPTTFTDEQRRELEALIKEIDPHAAVYIASAYQAARPAAVTTDEQTAYTVRAALNHFIAEMLFPAAGPAAC